MILKCTPFIVVGLYLLTKSSIGISAPSIPEQPLEKESYSLGVSVGRQIQSSFDHQILRIDNETFIAGIYDVLENHDLRLSDKHIGEQLEAFHQSVKDNQQKFVITTAQEHPEIFNTVEYPTQGSANSSITIIEFFDYQCPHCKKMNPVISDVLRNNPDTRIVYRHLPILGPTSRTAAIAAISADKQGKYQPFHNALMQTNPPLTREKIFKIAEYIGLDIKQLRADMDDDDVTEKLKVNSQLARLLKINSTPSYLIGPTKITEQTKLDPNKITFATGEISTVQLNYFVNTASQK